jgi:hypothetical protein
LWPDEKSQLCRACAAIAKPFWRWYPKAKIQVLSRHQIRESNPQQRRCSPVGTNMLTKRKAMVNRSRSTWYMRLEDLIQSLVLDYRIASVELV